MQTDLPARPDLPFKPELTTEPPPKRHKVWLWILAIVVALGVGGAVAQQNETSPLEYGTESGSFDSGASGLVSFEGTSVDVLVDGLVGTAAWDAVCALVPTVGLAETRQSFLDAEPQVGTDAYEGAVFDAAIARC